LLESLLLMFSIGILGSLHCMGMCGGLVAALCMSRPKVWWTGLVAYQAGRVASYSILGLLLGLFGSLLTVVGGWPVLRGLAIFAGLLMVVFGLNLAGWLPDPLRRFSALLSERIGLAAIARSLVQRSSLPGWITMGFVNGLLPCGLVYAALTMALASASGGMAMLMMFSFGLGTVPSMMFAPSMLRKFTPELRGWILRVAGVILVLLGVMTMLRDGVMHSHNMKDEMSHHSTMSDMSHVTE